MSGGKNKTYLHAAALLKPTHIILCKDRQTEEGAKK